VTVWISIPNRLFELEQRISRQISLARKHHAGRAATFISLLEEQQQLTIRPTRRKPYRWR
jgi:DNA repair ATPase RecN